VIHRDANTSKITVTNIGVVM